MAVTINDKRIDEKLDEMVNNLREEWGIKNASKTDALRFILKIPNQGKKTSMNWRRLFRNNVQERTNK